MQRGRRKKDGGNKKKMGYVGKGEEEEDPRWEKRLGERQGKDKELGNSEKEMDAPYAWDLG